MLEHTHSEKACNLLLGLALVSVPLLGTELASLHQREGCHKHHNEESCPLHYFDFFFHKRAEALCSFLKSFDQSEPWAQVVGPFVRFLLQLSVHWCCLCKPLGQCYLQDVFSTKIKKANEPTIDSLRKRQFNHVLSKFWHCQKGEGAGATLCQKIIGGFDKNQPQPEVVIAP